MMAWNSESRLCLTAPIAESPSTMYSSRRVASLVLHAVGKVHLLGHGLFDGHTRFFGVFTALLIDQHLLAGFFGFVRVLHKVHFQLVLEELCHGLGHKLVGNGLFGLVLITGAGREAGGNQN